MAAHIRFERKGSTRWEALDWSHVARGIGRCTPAILACYRLSAGAFVFWIDYALVALVQDAGGMTSRLIGGGLVFATFTVWCWTLLGLYFTLAGVISACDAFGWQPGAHHWMVRVLCRTIWVLFEVAFTCALLVFTVVWAVLVPAFYMYFGSDMGLLSFLPACVHNANLLLIGIEAVMNRLSFVRAHFVFVLYYGCAYVMFSWIFFTVKGFFFYFFIDWRYRSTLVSYTLLVGFLGAFFFLGQCVSHLTNASANDDEHDDTLGGECAGTASPDAANGDLVEKDHIGTV